MRIYRRGRSLTWTVEIWHQGRCTRKSLGTTDRVEAQELADRLKADVWRRDRFGERPAVTWDAAVLDWLESHQHLRSLRDRKDQLRWASRYLAGKRLDTIDRDALDALGKKKASTGVSGATVNRLLAAVSAILGHAHKKGWLTYKPPIPKRHEPERRIKWATKEQAQTLIAQLPTHLAAMAEFALATGLRRANVTHLQWSQVDLGRRMAWIHADQAKGKRQLAVPLSNSAVAVLQRQLGAHEQWVFPFRGKPIHQTAQAAWFAACDAAGLEDFHWHDLRHTWASWHVQNGTPLAVLQELGGWRDLKMVLRYAHLAPSHLAPYAENSGLPARPQDVPARPVQKPVHRARREQTLSRERRENGVADGTRTHDNRNHNPGLYQLSYSHHGRLRPMAACRLDNADAPLSRAHSGAPDRTRTCYRRLRRPVLYPDELRAPRVRVDAPAPPRAPRMVGVERFELPTSCSQSKRATGLRYTPRTAIMPQTAARQKLGRNQVQVQVGFYHYPKPAPLLTC
jgi:integrase